MNYKLMRSIVYFLLIIFLIVNGKFNYGHTQKRTMVFTDVAEESGINFRHYDGRSEQHYFVETIGSGCAFIDFDDDGYLDIYLVNATDLPGSYSPVASRNALYQNNRDGTFVDVTDQAGVGDLGYGTGITSADYNNDGFVDIYITNFGANILYKNNKDGTFIDVTKFAGVENPVWSAGASFGDYDGDGFVDLYVTNYCDFKLTDHKTCQEQGVEVYCGPEEFSGIPDTLYKNNGDGTFTDVTKSAGVFNPNGKGMMAVWSDYNDDENLDLFVANDGTENFLYQNNGGGTFIDIAWIAGVENDDQGNPQGSMGVDFADYDNDGMFDLIITNFQRQLNMLYRNDGDGLFSDATFTAGLGYTLPYVSWGIGFFDFDNDSFRDLFIANGHIQDHIELYDSSTTYLQPNHLLINDKDGNFTNVSDQFYLGGLKASRGVAFGDFDNDGDIDILINNAHDRPNLLRNDLSTDYHWISIKAVGTCSNRDGIGCRIKVFGEKFISTADIRSGASYMSQNDLRVHFGLGQVEKVNQIEIRWPSGIVDVIENVTVDQILTIVEGASQK